MWRAGRGKRNPRDVRMAFLLSPVPVACPHTRTPLGGSHSSTNTSGSRGSYDAPLHDPTTGRGRPHGTCQGSPYHVSRLSHWKKGIALLGRFWNSYRSRRSCWKIVPSATVSGSRSSSRRQKQIAIQAEEVLPSFARLSQLIRPRLRLITSNPVPPDHE